MQRNEPKSLPDLSTFQWKRGLSDSTIDFQWALISIAGVGKSIGFPARKRGGQPHKCRSD